MKLQLFPESCGFEVANWWCPLTDLNMYLFILLLSMGLVIIYYIGVSFYSYLLRKRMGIKLVNQTQTQEVGK